MLGNGALNDYFNSSAAALLASAEESKRRFELLERREQRQQIMEDAKIQQDMVEQKMNRLRALLADPNIPDSTKAIAEAGLNSLLREQLGL